MKKQSKIILISIGFILAILIALSFFPLFPSHPFGGCKDTPQKAYVSGPVSCPRSANFWQYIVDDLKYSDS